MNILKHIPTIIRTSSLNARVATFLGFCVIGIGIYLYATHQSDQTFAQEYASYTELAAQDDNAAYIPGAQVNPVRIELDQNLTQMLTGHITDTQRLALAQQGLGFLNDSKGQIDSITTIDDKVKAQVAKMQVNLLSNFASDDNARQIIVLAKERSSIISDIRAYSYRTDFELSQIFNTIIKDKGALTPTYTIELNNEIPTVQKEFDQRSSLYEELQTTSQQISAAYTALTGSATPVAPATTLGNQSGS